MDVEQPPGDANTVVEPFGLERLGGFARVAGDRALMDVSDVGEIEQVIDDELIVRFHMKSAGCRRPIRFR